MDNISRWKSKSININCFLDLQFFQQLFILFGLINLSVCLFEDQVGKFDWKQNYVGKLKFSQFDTVSTAKKIILATEENVVAALSLKTGQIIWRQILEQSIQGQIHHLHVDTEVVTISGPNSGPFLIRGWDLNTGILRWEWVLSTTTPVYPISWNIDHEKLFKITNQNGKVIIESYSLKGGQNKGTSAKLEFQKDSKTSNCILTNQYYTCLENNKLISANILSEPYTIKTIPFDNKDYILRKDFSLSGLPLIIVSSKRDKLSKLFKLTKNGIEFWRDMRESFDNDQFLTSYITSKIEDNHILIQLDNQNKTIDNIVIETNQKLESINKNFEIQTPVGNGKLFAAFCFLKKDRTPLCRYVVLTNDNSIVLLQSTGKTIWIRPESLTKIVAVDMLDLPVSDMDASLEKEFDNRDNNDIFGLPSDIYEMFVRRITNQAMQIKALVNKLSKQDSSLKSDEELVRDEFGLHKMIVVATSTGKLFGIDNKSGKIIWEKYLKNIEPFKNLANDKLFMQLYVQRTTRHFPHQAQCALIAKDKKTGNAAIYIFNPINGLPVNENLPDNLADILNFQVRQTLLLPDSDKNSLRGIVLMDNLNRLHCYPESSKLIFEKSSNKLYMFTANITSGLLNGYYLDAQKMVGIKSWEVQLKSRGQRIVDIVSKNPLERVHSQGRVLSDRSVLFKYVNPNLVIVATQVNDHIFKSILNIYLLDVVSGSIVYSLSHKRARLPIHIVHSENWIVYSYVNDKLRRTEICTMELYEGKVQKNSTIFSSLASPPLPFVEQQAYILPANVLVMKETITEKGITNKHVLMALTNGGVLEMPWIFLDPRRPTVANNEEGVVPYIPELPVPTEAFLNYNQSIERPYGILTVPSGLESTSLVFIYGLDIFSTRIAPSKTFDVLKEDFDYHLIILVLVCLGIATFLSRHFALRKTLNLAWK